MAITSPSMSATISAIGTQTKMIGMGRVIEVPAVSSLVICSATVTIQGNGLMPSPVTADVTITHGSTSQKITPEQPYTFRKSPITPKILAFMTNSVSNSSGVYQEGKVLYGLTCGSWSQSRDTEFTVDGKMVSGTVVDTLDVSGDLNEPKTVNFQLTAISGEPVFTLTPTTTSSGYGTLCNTDNYCEVYTINSAKAPYSLKAGTHRFVWQPRKPGFYSGKMTVVMNVP